MGTAVKDRRTGELAKVRVGDELAWYRRMGAGWSSSVVTKITPSGQMTLENGTRVPANGRIRYTSWDSTHCQPMTNKIRAEIELQNLNGKLNHLARKLEPFERKQLFPNATAEQLKQAIELATAALNCLQGGEQ